MDCEREPPKLAEGAIRIILRMDYHQLLSNLTSFLRDVCILILIN
jgi:Notch-like protein